MNNRRAVLSIGNTNAYLGLFSDTGDEFYSAGKKYFEYASNHSFNSLYAVSVSQRHSREILPEAEQYFADIEILTKDKDRLQTRYSVDDMGIDRFMNIYYIQRNRIYPSLIIDAGTADTFDFIDSDGMHIGGMIIPGTSAMNSALSYKTEIPPVDITADIDVMGTDTRSAVSSGIYSLWINGVMYFIELAGKTLGHADIIVTGGNGASIKEMIRETQFIPHLTLKGINRYAEDIYCSE